MEKESYKKSLVITGITRSDSENFTEVVVQIGRKLEIPILGTDIDDAWRFGKEKERTKVVFVRGTTKATLLKKIRERKRLSTIELGLDYENQAYLNDDLSVLAQTISRKARYLKSKNIIDNAWTSNGKVPFTP